MTGKDSLSYLAYFWSYRKTKYGLVVACLPIIILWSTHVFPSVHTDKNKFLIYSSFCFIVSLALFVWWLFHSGRVFLRNSNFTVVFCLKGKEAKGSRYIQNAISMLKDSLDRLGLLEKFRIVLAGEDIVNSQKEAYKYREKYNIDLVIWGEVFSGGKGNANNEACDFKGLLFTYKIPPVVNRSNLSNVFKTGINIAIQNRDWNVYEVNSLPDTEKIAAHLSEIIMFVLGLIYCQDKEFAEDSIVILESLFKQLNEATRAERPEVKEKGKEVKMNPGVFRKARVLGLLLNVYSNLGIYYTNNANHRKALFYLNKYLSYDKENTEVLSSLALSSYYIGDLPSARKYTEKIGKIDKDNPIFAVNRAYFAIIDKNYSDTLSIYKKIINKNFQIEASTVIEVIAFLDERKSEKPKELAYDFTIGLLNYYHCQRDLGTKELRQFVKQAKKNDEYRGMLNFVRENVFPQKRRKKGKK